MYTDQIVVPDSIEPVVGKSIPVPPVAAVTNLAQKETSILGRMAQFKKKS